MLNLQGFENWETRKINILAYLRQTAPDIVLFQEAVFLPELSAFNQAQLLNQELDYVSEHSAISRLQVGLEYSTYREGLAAISQLPIVKTDTIVLKQAPGDEHNRIVQFIDVLLDGAIIKFANVHFSLTDTIDFASAHFQETLDIIAERDEERIIVGDFNINNLDALAELWQEHYKASTEFSYISYPGMNKRNDYVLIPKSYKFTALSVSNDSLSDHRAITVDISTQPQIIKSKRITPRHEQIISA